MTSDHDQSDPCDASPEAQGPGASSGPPSGSEAFPVSSEDWQRTPATVRALFLRLLAELKERREQIAALRAQVEDLKERLATDSHNSSKPPSSDPPSSPGAKVRPGKPPGNESRGANPATRARAGPWPRPSRSRISWPAHRPRCAPVEGPSTATTGSPGATRSGTSLR